MDSTLSMESGMWHARNYVKCYASCRMLWRMPTVDQVQLSSHLKKVVRALEHVNSIEVFSVLLSLVSFASLFFYFYFLCWRQNGPQNAQDGKTTSHKAVSSSDAVQTVRMVRPFVGTFWTNTTSASWSLYQRLHCKAYDLSCHHHHHHHHHHFFFFVSLM